MALVRTSVLVRAPIDVVFDLVRDVGIRTRGLAHVRERALAPGPTSGPVCRGDRLSLRGRHAGRWRRYDLRVTVCDPPSRLVLELEGGPWHALRHECRLVRTGAGTLLVEEVRWRAGTGPLGRAVDAFWARRHLRRLLLVRDAHLRMVAEQGVAAADADAETERGGPQAPRVVVGIALRDTQGRILAALRRDGGWELPGGKVEPGESEPEALVRECREELDVEVEVADRLDGEEALPGAGPAATPAVLRVWTGRIVTGDPVARVHDALRWLPPEQLSEVDWLPADAPFVARLRDAARDPGPA